MIRLVAVVAIAAGLAAGCRPGVPVVDTGPKPPTQEGTIAGHVSTDGGAPVVTRVVRAIATDGSRRFEASTTSTGAYSMKVPPGRYRIELDLRPEERLVKGPGETEVNASDLDPDRDFVITAAPR